KIRAPEFAEPPRDEEAGAEGRGADVEAVPIPLHAQVRALGRKKAALLPVDVGVGGLGDLPLFEGGAYRGVIVMHRVVEGFDQVVPVGDDERRGWLKHTGSSCGNRRLIM